MSLRVVYIYILLTVLCASQVWAGKEKNASQCTKDMFGKDAYALYACHAQNALQRNWYPSPIAGLYSYQAWNGFDGFWQNGCVLETFANFMSYASHTRYKHVLLGSIRTLNDLLAAYYPQPSYDDMAWYGLSYLRIYELFKEKMFLTRAKEIFDWNWQNGWDTSRCGGGMWFDQGLNSKVTITNVQMLHLAAKLYRLTGSHDKTLLKKLNLVWEFITKHKLINSTTNLISDGIFLNNCTRVDNFGPTYSSGVLVGGLLHMSHIYSNQAYMFLAHALANAVIQYKSVDGILTEDCDVPVETCGDDNKVFKGIFVRNLRYLMDESNSTTREYYQKWMLISGASLLHNDTCGMKDIKKENCTLIYTDGLPFYNVTGPVFDTSWHGPYNHSSPMPQASALDLLVSLIQPGTKCKGGGCGYDPPTPPPRPMTCKGNPCPTGRVCCDYQGGYRTCCESTQKCVGGFCE